MDFSDAGHDPEHAVILGVAPAAEAVQPEHETKVDAPYLLFADRGGVAESLAMRLRDRGHRAVLTWPGEQFLERSAEEYVIRADAEEDIAEMLRRPATRDLAGVIHCWSLDQNAIDAMTADDLRAAQKVGVSARSGWFERWVTGRVESVSLPATPAA